MLTKLQELDNFAHQLKEAGFTVILTEESPHTGLSTFLHFWKDGRMGYVQKSHFGGYDFFTVHKPSKQNGTGFGVLDMTELTLENAQKALSKPGWALNDKVDYYNSPEEFVAKEQILKYYIL